MKIKLTAILLLFIAGTINAKQDKGKILTLNNIKSKGRFEINGNISSARDGDWKVVLKWADGPNHYKDTVSMVGGKFKILGSIFYDPCRAYIQLIPPGHPPRSNYDDYNYFFLENSDIDITGSSLKEAKIKGGPTQLEYLKLGVGPLHVRAIELGLKAMQTRDDSLRAVYRRELDSLGLVMRNLNRPFIIANNDSYLTLYYLLQWVSRVQPSDQLFFNQIVDGLSPRLKNTFSGKQIEKVKHLSIGGTAPDFIQPDSTGKPLRLSSLRGKYVLIEFWASWCGPCRQENPKLVTTYNRFKNSGFEILGVSLDHNRSSWIQAIKQDNLHWIHVSDLLGSKMNTTALEYEIKGVPQNYLLDPNGIIVGKNLRGAAVAGKLEEIFGGKGGEVKTTSQIVAENKVENLRVAKDWKNFEIEVLAFMKKYGNSVAPQLLNRFAWAVFENVSDLKVLGEALGWSKRSFKNNNRPDFLDTYANILYKLGRRDEALEWEQKALELAVGEKSTYQQTLDKIKKGEKTWRN